MGTLRIESGYKYLEQIILLPSVNTKVKLYYFASLFFAFAFPISPAFFTDFLVIKYSIDSKIIFKFTDSFFKFDFLFSLNCKNS
jgi:hypothetical protein